PVPISGNVYEDKLGTGALAPGDLPIPGTTLTLPVGGVTSATTTAAAAGTYSFTTDSGGMPLPPATYKVTETQPAGYLQGSNTVEIGRATCRERLDPVDMIGSIDLTSGQDSVGNNFGEVKPGTISADSSEDTV